MTEKTSGEVAEIVERYDSDPGMLIPIMQDVQAACGYLPQVQMKEVSSRLKVPLAQIYSVATFYASFRLMPKGEHTIQLCMGTVCFLKGADKIAKAIQKEFDLVPGSTSPDGKFTFAPVNCVGACALAPVMVLDGQYHGNLVVDTALDLMHRVAAGEQVAAATGLPTGGKKKKAKKAPKASQKAPKASKKAAKASNEVLKKAPKKASGGKKK